MQDSIRSKDQTTLTWFNVSAKAKDKSILQNSTGYCAPGQMLAIMGPSGAGKTTLLSILAAKNNKDIKVQGKVMANKQAFTDRQFYNFAGFVFQNDILYETLTVKQTLQFTAKMKIKDANQAEERVKHLIQQFQLQKCSDTYVGGKFIKGISGGEKKRVCIAVEMMSKPSMLVLDEPTSGLDSHMAVSILKVLKKLTEQRKTIVFTIHQPSGYIYSMLDRLIILDRGNTLYQGKADQVQTYIENLGIKIPNNTTMSDFFMMEISQFKARRQDYKTPLNLESYQKQQQKQIEDKTKTMQVHAPDGQPKSSTAKSMFQQYRILFGRQVTIFLRNKMKAARLYGNAIFTIILIGLIFLNAISDQRPPLTPPYPPYFAMEYIFIALQGAMFIVVTSNTMNSIFTVTLVFPAQRTVFSKETASKTYDALSYYIAKICIEVPTLCSATLLFSVGVYLMMGFDLQIDKLLRFCVIIISISLVGNSIGFMTGSLFQDAQRAAAMAPAIILPLMMFSGLYNKLNDIPDWIAWMQYLSPFKYGLHALLLNQLGQINYPTDPATGGKPYNYRQDLGINQTLWENVSILLGLSVLFYVLAFFFLRSLKKSIAA